MWVWSRDRVVSKFRDGFGSRVCKDSDVLRYASIVAGGGHFPHATRNECRKVVHLPVAWEVVVEAERADPLSTVVLETCS